LPADFFSSLPGLEVLDVAHNALSALPAGIASCSRLRVLTLSANVLTALPDDMADLCHLEELRARYFRTCLALSSVMWLRFFTVSYQQELPRSQDW
jgi:Leucine-rich repeat (LRR) protein